MIDGIFSIPNAGISSSSQSAKDILILRPGQIVPGVVLEADSMNAVILINGINVVAELDTTVIPGEKLMLQVVDQLADGKVILQRAVVSNGQQKQEADGGELQRILNNLGIRNNELNVMLVEALVRSNIPISRKTVEMLSAVALKNSIAPRQVLALVWLWSRGLPINKDSIAAVAHLMDGGFQDTPMGELRTRLPQSIENSISETVKQLLLLPEETQGQWGQKLFDTPRNLGFGHERDLLRLLENVSRHDHKGLGETSKFSVPSKEGEAQTLKAALIEMLNRPDQPKGETAGSLESIAGKMLKDITGFQLLNIVGRQEGDGIATFIPGWMVMQDNEIQPFFLKVKEYSGGSRDVEPDYLCQVLFFISTQGMGEVMCRLVLQKDCLTCGFTVNGEKELKLLDGMLPILQERLRPLPWDILIYPSKILDAEEIHEIWYEETFVPHQNSFKGLDARV